MVKWDGLQRVISSGLPMGRRFFEERKFLLSGWIRKKPQKGWKRLFKNLVWDLWRRIWKWWDERGREIPLERQKGVSRGVLRKQTAWKRADIVSKWTVCGRDLEKRGKCGDRRHKKLILISLIDFSFCILLSFSTDVIIIDMPPQ